LEAGGGREAGGDCGGGSAAGEVSCFFPSFSFPMPFSSDVKFGGNGPTDQEGERELKFYWTRKCVGSRPHSGPTMPKAKKSSDDRNFSDLIVFMKKNPARFTN
jgi:hypothetical protein